jgi:hypothetical protein
MDSTKAPTRQNPCLLPRSPSCSQAGSDVSMTWIALLSAAYSRGSAAQSAKQSIDVNSRLGAGSMVKLQSLSAIEYSASPPWRKTEIFAARTLKKSFSVLSGFEKKSQSYLA